RHRALHSFPPPRSSDLAPASTPPRPDAVPPPRAETAAERMALMARAPGAPVAAPTAATLAAATVAATAPAPAAGNPLATAAAARSEEHTSELQSRANLV